MGGASAGITAAVAPDAKGIACMGAVLAPPKDRSECKTASK